MKETFADSLRFASALRFGGFKVIAGEAIVCTDMDMAPIEFCRTSNYSPKPGLKKEYAACTTLRLSCPDRHAVTHLAEFFRDLIEH